MHQRLLTLALIVFCHGLALRAQLTINVYSVPSNTPAGDDVFLAGNLNGWNPGDPNYILSDQGNDTLSITVSPPPGVLEFKFTRGSWPTVEGDANGNVIPNRTYNYSGQPGTINLSILSWEDQGGSSGNSTAAPNVTILDNDFYIPQLNRTRRIWLYLPPDYDSSGKQYPVLYMHDGQNLFDRETAFSGEWEVDESLNQLFEDGDYGCIVVGIDNGGASRLDEYSPWVNPQYGGGEGEAYVEFITDVLKPHIDSLYRTRPGRVTTGIMGSSMGGLISMYAFTERQDVFSRAGVFSPSFWFAGNEVANHVAANPREGEARVYFLAGGQEPPSTAQNIQLVAAYMLGAGFSQDEIFYLVEPDGQHSEWFWAREFPEAYQWLFSGLVSHTDEPVDSFIQVFPNPSKEFIRLAYNNKTIPVYLQIWDASGKIVREVNTSSNEPVYVGDLAAGYYVIRIKEEGKGWKIGKMVR